VTVTSVATVRVPMRALAVNATLASPRASRRPAAFSRTRTVFVAPAAMANRLFP
jgi:hypothetical protein